MSGLADPYGEFLKAKREEAGLSQEAVAQATSLGVQSTVWKIESGRRGLLFHEAVELADVLGFTLEDLADTTSTIVSREQLWARANVALRMARNADEREIARLAEVIEKGEQT